MSRGCGKLQRALLSFIVGNNDNKPITYAEIVGNLLQASGVNDPTAKLRPDRERAIRRALKGLCDRDLLSAFGTGRPGDPYRYTLASVCKLCGEGDRGEPMLSCKHWSICARCVGAIAQGYFKELLPEIVARKSASEIDEVSAAPTSMAAAA
jgi:hypothetical protein